MTQLTYTNNLTGSPSWVRAVRRETLGRRRLVKGTYGPGIGVGFLGAYDIDVPAMAAAYEHVNAIARGIKRLGDTAPWTNSVPTPPLTC